MAAPHKFHSLVNSERWPPRLHCVRRLLYAIAMSALSSILYGCLYVELLSYMYRTMMRPFATTEPLSVVAKHCDRGRQVGRIGHLQILISKTAAVWVSTNQR